MDEWHLAKESVARKIAGDIVLSEDCGKTIQKWRNIFKIPQKTLAEKTNVTPSVISDYESGRRKSPGMKVIKKIVDALIAIDESSGGKVVKEFSEKQDNFPITKSVMDLKEFSRGISASGFCDAIGANLVAGKDAAMQDVYGYTIIDSLKAIVEFSFAELVKLYGITNKRVLIFTNVTRGRSPMVAIKVTNLRPGLVIMHGISNADEIAMRIADAESIPLAVLKTDSADALVETLRKKFS